MYSIIIIIFMIIFIFNIFNIEKSIKFIKEFKKFEHFDFNILKKEKSKYIILFSLKENLHSECTSLMKFLNKNNKNKDFQKVIKIVCNPEYFKERKDIEFLIENNINTFPSIAIFQNGIKLDLINLE